MTTATKKNKAPGETAPKRLSEGFPLTNHHTRTFATDITEPFDTTMRRFNELYEERRMRHGDCKASAIENAAALMAGHLP